MTGRSPWELPAHPRLAGPTGPVCLVVLDGVGLGPEDGGNAWHLARTPFLDGLMRESPVTGSLAAHGTAVGMPSDGDMGNSEVGHNALGAGRVFDQGAKLVDEAVRSGAVFAGDTWQWVVDGCRGQGAGTLHIMGLWSDGNVHSHVAHAYALMERAIADGVGRIRVHVLIDGRDVGETSAMEYLEPLEARLAAWRAAGTDIAVASGGGRMVTTMDRYEADWSVVERGWAAHVHGEAERFPSASTAVRGLRAAAPGTIDQYLPAFVVADESGPVGPIRDGDAVVFFNFRGDRALEISRAFEAEADADFPFDRGQVPAVRFAGMMEYDGDLHVPARYLVEPPQIERTVGEYLARNGRKQLAISETQKFGHVTYFFNGNRSGMFDEALERYIEVPSDRVEFDQRPWMKAAEITDQTLAALDTFGPDFVRLNFANGDMVGHTGVLPAAMMAMEALDISLARLVRGVLSRGGTCVVTADHGNCEEMFARDKRTGAFVPSHHATGFKPSTSHSLNAVPLAIVGPGAGTSYHWNATLQRPGLSNLAATCLELMGLQAPEGFDPSVLRAS